MALIDFEKKWRERFAENIEAVAGREMREQIMSGVDVLPSGPDASSTIVWTIDAIERLEHQVDTRTCIDIMTGCACQYPKDELHDIKRTYNRTGDIRTAHTMLQEKFVTFLRRHVGLTDEVITDIIGRGWGLAGVLDGDVVIATKIPKSGFLKDYLEERDPDKKRALYCHCPRVRNILKTCNAVLSPTYCYCGAGFYRGIWEEILERPTRVELLKTVMRGDDVCQFKVMV
jgi:hypothetical protein